MRIVKSLSLMFISYFNEHFRLKIKGSDPLLLKPFCGLRLLYKTLMNKCNADAKRIYMILLSVTVSSPTEIDMRLNTEPF